MNLTSSFFSSVISFILLVSCTLSLHAQNTNESVKFRILSKTVFHQGNDSTAFLNEHMNWGDTKSNISNGYLTSTWGRNNIASENQATAWGIGNQAISWNTTAFGNSTKATGSHATSWGAFTEASGNYSTASGKETKVSGAYSMGWGNKNMVSGSVSAGWGSLNNISGGGGAVWGFSNTVTGQASTSWGSRNIVSADTSTVWGSNNQVGGKLASAWGTGNINQGHLATSWGSNNSSTSYLSTVFGRYNVVHQGSPEGWKEQETLLQIGNGNEDERRDAIVVLKDGSVGINFGSEDGIPKEKLEVYGSIRSSETVVGEKLIANSKVGIGTANPSEELVIKTTQDTSHLVIQSTGNSSLVDLKGLNQSAIRFFETDQEVAQLKWSGSNFEIFSTPPTEFPVLRFPILKMTPDNKLSINPGLSTPIEVLEIGGRLKLGYNDQAAAAGVMRFNSQVNAFEGYNGSEWLNFTGQLMDDDGDSQINFVEDNVDSITFVVNTNEEMSFNGHSLSLGKNGNTFIGFEAVKTDYNNNIENTTIGAQSASFMFNGEGNTSLGYMSANLLTSGDRNVYLGAYSGKVNQSGSQNTMIGFNAGSRNIGAGNVFIGHNAGSNELGDNKLYIDNFSTPNPLIYGDFAENVLEVNGDMYLPSEGNGSKNQNLVIAPDGQIIAENDSVFIFYSGDFSDWLSQVNGVQRAVSINREIRNGAEISEILVKALRYNPFEVNLNLRLMKRNTQTGTYTIVESISYGPLPTVPQLYLQRLSSPEIIDVSKYEYLLTSGSGATQIISVVLR